MTQRKDILEQLSAYLDGELSGPDALGVEQALAADADLARDFAALKAAREMIRRLPRSKAPADFAQRVLAQAERQRLTHASARPAALSLGWVGRLAIAASLLVVASSGIIVALSMREKAAPSGSPVNLAAREDESVAAEKSLLRKSGGGVVGLSGDNRIAMTDVRKDAVDGYREALDNWDRLRTSADKNVALDAEDLKAGREAVEAFLAKRGYQYRTNKISDSETEILVVLPPAANVPKVENDLISDALVQRSTALAMMPVRQEAADRVFDAAMPPAPVAIAPTVAQATADKRTEKGDMKARSPDVSEALVMKSEAAPAKAAALGKVAARPTAGELETRKQKEQEPVQIATADAAPAPAAAPMPSAGRAASGGSRAMLKTSTVGGGAMAAQKPGASQGENLKTDERVAKLAPSGSADDAVMPGTSRVAGETSRAAGVSGKELARTSPQAAVGVRDSNKAAEENRDAAYISTPVTISTPGGDAMQQSLSLNSGMNQTAALGNTYALNSSATGTNQAVQSNTGYLNSAQMPAVNNGTLTVVNQSQSAGSDLSSGQYQSCASQPAWQITAAGNGGAAITGGTLVLEGMKPRQSTDAATAQPMEQQKRRGLGDLREASSANMKLQAEVDRLNSSKPQTLLITLNRRAEADRSGKAGKTYFYSSASSPASRPADTSVRQAVPANSSK